MARLSSGMPGPGGYWLPRPARIASAAARAISGGPSRSGKPWPRLIDPVATARADISAKIVVPRPSRRRLRNGLLTVFMMPCSLWWEHASRTLPDPGQLEAFGERGAGPGGAARGRGPGRGPGRVPRGDAGQVWLGPAGGGRAAGRAVLLGAVGVGQTDGGRAGGGGVRARAGRARVQHRRGLRRRRGTGRVLPEAAPVRRVRTSRVGRRGAGIGAGRLHAGGRAGGTGDLLRRAVRGAVPGAGGGRGLVAGAARGVGGGAVQG